MHHSEFTRAVARSTGEDMKVIAGRGFSLVDDSTPVDDDDIDAIIADWNSIQAEEFLAKARWQSTQVTRTASPRNRLAAAVKKSRAVKFRRQASAL